MGRPPRPPMDIGDKHSQQVRNRPASVDKGFLPTVEPEQGPCESEEGAGRGPPLPVHMILKVLEKQQTKEKRQVQRVDKEERSRRYPQMVRSLAQKSPVPAASGMNRKASQQMVLLNPDLTDPQH